MLVPSFYPKIPVLCKPILYFLIFLWTTVQQFRCIYHEKGLELCLNCIDSVPNAICCPDLSRLLSLVIATLTAVFGVFLGGGQMWTAKTPPLWGGKKTHIFL